MTHIDAPAVRFRSGRVRVNVAYQVVDHEDCVVVVVDCLTKYAEAVVQRTTKSLKVFLVEGAETLRPNEKAKRQTELAFAGKQDWETAIEGGRYEHRICLFRRSDG